MFSLLKSQLQAWMYSQVIKFYNWRLSAWEKYEHKKSLEDSEDE